MKSYLIVPLALGLLAVSGAAQDKLDLKDPKQRVSYSIGSDIGGKVGGSLKREEIEFDAKALAAGFADALAGKLALTDAEIGETMKAFQKQMMEKAQAREAQAEARDKAAGEKNIKEGQAFLAANAKKEGVKVLPSGLQYKVIKSGNGKTPKATDFVKTHYHGTLVDGSVFDSSVERKEPVTFPVNGVIAGWTEALQLMKEGDKWQLFIPAKLAYGEESRPPKITPNSALIFEIELLSIEKSGQ
jgi:FKBP-type peptidyl-prolyl cis-trans isomerase FklB